VTGITGITGLTGPTGAASSPVAEPAPPAQSEAAAEATPAAEATSQKVEPPFIIDTNKFRVALSYQGATVRSWVLKGFKGNDNKPLELLNTAAGGDFPFSLYFSPDAPKPTTNVNWAWYSQAGDPDGLGVTYTFSDGHTSVRKVFRFEKNSY